MNRFPPELADRLSDYSIGDQLYWKTVFNNCLDEINQFSDEAMVDKYLCRLNVSVDEFVLDFRAFISFVKQYKFYDKLIGRVFVFCCEYDHPFIDVIAHQLLEIGMLFESPGEACKKRFNKCLKGIELRGKTD